MDDEQVKNNSEVNDDQDVGEFKEDEVREKLAEEFGFDPESDADKLDKLVERERQHNEKLSGAIKQKINWRKRAESKATSNSQDKGKSQNDGADIDAKVDQRVHQILEQRELKSLELPEEVERETVDLATLKGISVREAAEHPYIKQMLEEHKRKQRVLNATPTRKGRANYQPSFDPSKPLNPQDYDFSSDEGVQAWNDAKAARNKWLEQNKS